MALWERRHRLLAFGGLYTCPILLSSTVFPFVLNYLDLDCSTFIGSHKELIHSKYLCFLVVCIEDLVGQGVQERRSDSDDSNCYMMFCRLLAPASPSLPSSFCFCPAPLKN